MGGLSAASEGVIITDQMISGIKSQTSNLKSQTNFIYDLQGRRVSAEANFSLFTLHSSLKKGLYIIDGRKTLVK
jgi:hypothetical protein